MDQETYIENEVLTASPGKLVVMLYDGAIKFLKRLDDLDYSKDIETKVYNINKAYAIISELQCTLDMTQGDVSVSLFSLYNYMQKQLIEANMKNDSEQVQHVINLLSELKDSWHSITEIEETNERSHDGYDDTELVLTDDGGERIAFSMAG